MRRMNKGKLEIVKQEIEHLNIAVLGVNEIKQTELGHFPLENYYVFYLENDLSELYLEA